MMKTVKLVEKLNNLYASERYKAVVNMSDKILAQEPNNIDALITKADALDEMGDTPAAIEIYRQALSVSPRCNRAWYNLGLAYARSNKLKEAIAAWRRAFQVCHEDSDSLFCLGNVMYGQNRFKMAIRYYRRAAAIQPDNCSYLYNLANVLRIKGELREAERIYFSVLEINPDDINTLCNLGLTLNKLKEYGVAQNYLERALALRPDDGQCVANLVDSLLGQGKRERAISLVKDYSHKNPDTVIVKELVLRTVT